MTDFRHTEPDFYEQRFVTLETKVAYQDKTILDLNEVVVAQSRRIENYERRLRALEEQLKSLLSAAESSGEPPPHY